MDFVNLYEWILTITADDLPRPPICHGQAVIVNTKTWLENLQFIARTSGPKSPRAAYGALQEDLCKAYELHNEFAAVSGGRQGRDTAGVE